MNQLGTRSYILLLLLTSGIGYLQWGGGNDVIVFQAELDILRRLFGNPQSVMHPFIVLPLLGQVILGISLFSQSRKPWVLITAIWLIGALYLVFLLVGILSMQWLTVISSIPFLSLAIYFTYRLKNKMDN